MMKLWLHCSCSELEAAHTFIAVNDFSQPPPCCPSSNGSQVTGLEDTAVVIWELPDTDLCDTQTTCFSVIFVSYLGGMSI